MLGTFHKTIASLSNPFKIYEEFRNAFGVTSLQIFERENRINWYKLIRAWEVFRSPFWQKTINKVVAIRLMANLISNVDFCAELSGRKNLRVSNWASLAEKKLCKKLKVKLLSERIKFRNLLQLLRFLSCGSGGQWTKFMDYINWACTGNSLFNRSKWYHYSRKGTSGTH